MYEDELAFANALADEAAEIGLHYFRGDFTVSRKADTTPVTEADIEIDILYAGARAEDFALANARDAVILGTKLKAASPEALLWLYLVSEKPINFADALEIMRSAPGVDVALVREQLERHQPELLGKLEKMVHAARQPVPSYEESRARRS